MQPFDYLLNAVEKGDYLKVASIIRQNYNSQSFSSVDSITLLDILCSYEESKIPLEAQKEIYKLIIPKLDIIFDNLNSFFIFRNTILKIYKSLKET